MPEINYRGLDIPRAALGRAVSTDNLFDPNEQVIFDFYEANRGRYRRALDVGANIGVHSILMARAGWEVVAFEPDPEHFARLRRNLAHHAAAGVRAHQVAVSDRVGEGEFVRVLDNTTASHLAGARASYGPRERLRVQTVDFWSHFEGADFAKIDCEGHEATLVRAVPVDAWARRDALLEVGSYASASAIYLHLIDAVPMWSQKTGWARVQHRYDMPAHHSEGSLFIGRDPPFPTRDFLK